MKNRWTKYECYKKRLYGLGLDPVQYEAIVKIIADLLGV